MTTEQKHEQKVVFCRHVTRHRPQFRSANAPNEELPFNGDNFIRCAVSKI